MLDAIEKLLILQDRDLKAQHLEAELETVEPQRAGLQTRTQATREALEAARQKLRHLDSARKQLELEVEEQKQHIGRYSLQQFETKKNEEYKALSKEIAGCQAAIVRLEDQQLELMEQAEAVQKVIAGAAQQAETSARDAEALLTALAGREQHLRQQLADARNGRERLAAAVEAGLLARYERLRRSKGGQVVVGVDHSSCGGCHMQLPTHVVLGAQAGQEVAACPNCGRILYHHPDMDVAVRE
jgi:predicted  nucleic acid-binding Zn-ribbon protein